jgi:CheY-like chemotaxis protein
MTDQSRIVAIVDDDPIYRFTSLRSIERQQLASKILEFNSGGDALEFLKNNSGNASHLPDFILLDINMPLTDGWMFLDEFDKLKSLVPKSIVIYMVSSSIDQRDIQRAKSNALVKDYLIKPIPQEKFKEVLN